MTELGHLAWYEIGDIDPNIKFLRLRCRCGRLEDFLDQSSFLLSGAAIPYLAANENLIRGDRSAADESVALCQLIKEDLSEE
jgi:hypothetical protein